jgi:hypothetical protein
MRLIDADALAEKAYWHGEHPDVGNPFAEGVEAVDVSDVDEAPTIDAEPVRHGRWVLKNTCGPHTGKLHCSVCDKIPKSLCVEHYCPNCGAKMDGDKYAN